MKGKKARANHLTAIADLRDMPGTRIMFWVVDACPYCGGQHLHVAGNLRSADPGEALGEQPAPCDPERVYELTLAPPNAKNSAKKKKGKRTRRTNWDDEDW